MPDRKSTQRRRGPGRPSGAGGSREAILDSARALFGARGYDGASLRAIASGAEVDPAMIRHFFTDKEGLFAATIADRTAIPERMIAAFDGDVERAGHRLANAYFDMWEDDETGPMLRAVVRTAVTSTKAADLVRELVAGRIVGSFDEDADREMPLRVALIGSHLLGIAAARYLIGIEPIERIPRDDLVEVIAPVLTRYLTAPLSDVADHGAASDGNSQ